MYELIEFFFSHRNSNRVIVETDDLGFWGNRDASDMNAELKKQENGKRGSFSIG